MLMELAERRLTISYTQTPVGGVWLQGCGRSLGTRLKEQETSESKLRLPLNDQDPLINIMNL